MAGETDQFPYGFPVQPYEIQVELMDAMTRAMDAGSLAILESPTGTGKSLSLICASLTWLKKQRAKQLLQVQTEIARRTMKVEEAKKKASSGNNPSWVTEQTADAALQEIVEAEQSRQQKLLQFEKTVKRAREVHTIHKVRKTTAEDRAKHFLTEAEDRQGNDSDDEFLIDEELKSETDKLSDDEQETMSLEVTPKIFYCSRTHSQISQFVNELARTQFGDNTKVVSLGSRATLCINDSVRSLSSNNAVNDKCHDLEKGKGCDFRSQAKTEIFRDHALARVQDIEALVVTGKKLRACPYFGSRAAIAAADVVTMPYNMLFHQGTRESLGLKMEGNVIIIDEGHNLLDVLSAIHSTELTGAKIGRCHAQLSTYRDRFQTRLKPSNLTLVNQLLYFLNSLLSLLRQHKEETVTTVVDFLHQTRVDSVNFFDLLRSCESTELARKLHGYHDKYQPEVNVSSEEISRSVSSLHYVEEFVRAINNAHDDKDGRVLIHPDPRGWQHGYVKYLHLNPGIYFAKLLGSGCVIIAGGTMSPMNDMLQQLLAPISSPPSIVTLSCKHIIPSSNLCVQLLSRGPSNLSFNFTYENRNKPELLKELGQVIINVCQVADDGVVVFFPSYAYEQVVYDDWTKRGVLQVIEKRKAVFREAQGSVDSVLEQYSAHIRAKKSSGAILLSGVGGRLSEGINFKVKTIEK